MAVEKRYPEQFGVVCTATQKRHMEKEARKRRSSLADVVRRAIDQRYGLIDGEEPEEEGGGES